MEPVYWASVLAPGRQLRALLSAWAKGDAKKLGVLARRITTGIREVGVLLVAFAPLDVVINRGKAWIAAVFLVIGIGLFCMALDWELSHPEEAEDD